MLSQPYQTNWDAFGANFDVDASIMGAHTTSASVKQYCQPIPLANDVTPNWCSSDDDIDYVAQAFRQHDLLWFSAFQMMTNLVHHHLDDSDSDLESDLSSDTSSEYDDSDFGSAFGTESNLNYDVCAFNSWSEADADFRSENGSTDGFEFACDMRSDFSSNDGSEMDVMAQAFRESDLLRLLASNLGHSLGVTAESNTYKDGESDSKLESGSILGSNSDSDLDPYPDSDYAYDADFNDGFYPSSDDESDSDSDDESDADAMARESDRAHAIRVLFFVLGYLVALQLLTAGDDASNSDLDSESSSDRDSDSYFDGDLGCQIEPWSHSDSETVVDHDYGYDADVDSDNGSSERSGYGTDSDPENWSWSDSGSD